MSMRIPLSVLDLAPIARGETASSSIAATVALATAALGWRVGRNVARREDGDPHHPRYGTPRPTRAT